MSFRSFHHLVRRKLAVTDSGLAYIKDVAKHVASLPLSSDGVFDAGLETKLKERNERTKQIKELLPEFKRPANSDSFKRKSSSQGYASDAKRFKHYTAPKRSKDEYSSSFRPSFRKNDNSYRGFSNNRTNANSTSRGRGYRSKQQ